MVRATGLEPARFWQWNLNPPSLPIPPCPQICLLQQEYPNTKRAVCQCRLAARRRAKLLFWNTPTRAIMPMTIPRNSPVDWRVDVLWRWQAKMIAMITRQNRSLMISLKAYCLRSPYAPISLLPYHIAYQKISFFVKNTVYLLHRTMAPMKAMLSAKANPSVFRRVALRKQYRLLTFSGICEKIAALNLETREAFL